MPKKPKKLCRGDIVNFETLKTALHDGNLALVSAIRKEDQKQVALVCAMNSNDDDTIMPVPLAEMIGGNPFELYEDPMV